MPFTVSTVVTLWVDRADPTERVLVDTLGFRPAREDGTTRRYVVGDGAAGTIVDVRAVGGFGVAPEAPASCTTWRSPWRRMRASSRSAHA